MIRTFGLASMLAATLGLAACGGTSPLPATSMGSPASPAAIVTASGGNVNSATTGPIPGDPLPGNITNGTTYTFATCVPVFNDQEFAGAGSWVQVGCTSTAQANVNGWVIDGNYATSLDCIVRYDTPTGDIVEFFCSGNPY